MIFNNIASGLASNILFAGLIRIINLFRPHTKSVFEKILGNWIGTTVQTTNIKGNNVTVKLNVDFYWTISGIGGKAVVIGRGDPVSVRIKGNINKANFIILEYYNTTNLTNFGNMILKLDSNGDKLEGVVIGFGNVSDKLILGKTELIRV